MIWQCNSKFDRENRCSTPIIDTETVKSMFIKAYNRLMAKRSSVSEDCELMRRSLTDFTSLDAEIAKQREETAVVAELVKAVVKENAATSQSQEEYMKKYESLTKRYEAAASVLEKLTSERLIREQQSNALSLFIRTLKKNPQLLVEWNDTIWTVMVEKAIVHKNGSIIFVFYNGSEIEVEAE